MYVALYERNVADVQEAMNLARLDNQNVSWASLMVLSIDGPASTALSHECHFIIGMTMPTGSPPRWGVDEIG
jgi:hypothetical protein